MLADLSASELLSLFYFSTPVVLLALLWSWESWAAFKPFRGENRYRHAFYNLSLAVLNSLLLGLLFGSAVEATSAWTMQHQWGLLHQLPLSPFWQTLCAILFLDAWMFCWHWMNHRIPVLWRFHRMHHSDPAMDVSTATRFHWGELGISTLLRLMLIPLLGLQSWQLVLYGILVFLSTQLHHANISLGRADRFYRWLFVSPDMHKIHHSRLPQETNSNYSTIFSLWDRLARTYRMRLDLTTIDFGLPHFDQPQWQTLLGMWKTPFSRPPVLPGKQDQQAEMID